MYKKNYLVIMLMFLLHNFLTAQEALKSIEEEYYDFLALQGLTERPALNYRTLSDSVWPVNAPADADGEEDSDASHPWQNQNLGTWHNLFGDFRMRVYGPELFMSGNTAAPYGQNDGVLWQGRGFNALLKSGVRFEGYGIELTLLPHLAFSQNAPFEIMPSSYKSEYGYYWGYAHNIGADAPQRFGNKPFFDWDFGDSEIRYTWKTLTVGFGTQAIWLGPSYLNSILHTNNAPVYPKFDIGLRRQRVSLPWLNWYMGDVEARIWLGRLAESDYFDSDDSNNFTMYSGLSFAYSPSFLQGLTLFANRICLIDWKWENIRFVIPSKENTIEDQKVSFGFSWLFPQVGFEVFGEMGMDDIIVDGMIGVVRNPFHATVYSAGLKKAMQIIPERNIYGKIVFEFNWMEMTQDFQFEWYYSYYFHHQIIHGYTNKGQWIGSGLGSGGNSQHLAFDIYYPCGSSSIFLQRNSPDNNYLYKNAVYDTAGNFMLRAANKDHNKSNLNIGITTSYFLNKYLNIYGGMVYNLMINPYYQRTKGPDGVTDFTAHGGNTLIKNFSFQLGLKAFL